ncbi:MAG: hypothetical protein OEZ36_09895 [Spirochaetota bacterium]|nr:hypothetical protein [Spirochaetota bacterium]
MANRKKYIEKILKMENLRKRRLAKKLKRQKKLAGRRKELLNKANKTPAGVRPGMVQED